MRRLHAISAPLFVFAVTSLAACGSSGDDSMSIDTSITTNTTLDSYTGISGTLRDGSGQPIAGTASYVAANPSDPENTAEGQSIVEADGLFTFTGMIADRYTVSATSGTLTCTPQTVSVQTRTESVADITCR